MNKSRDDHFRHASLSMNSRHHSLTHSMAHRIASDEFGSIMVMLFIGLASALVQVLLEWWLTSDMQRSAFAAWKRELR